MTWRILGVRTMRILSRWTGYLGCLVGCSFAPVRIAAHPEQPSQLDIWYEKFPLGALLQDWYLFLEIIYACRLQRPRQTLQLYTRSMRKRCLTHCFSHESEVVFVARSLLIPRPCPCQTRVVQSGDRMPCMTIVERVVRTQCAFYFPRFAK